MICSSSWLSREKVKTTSRQSPAAKGKSSRRKSIPRQGISWNDISQLSLRARPKLQGVESCTLKNGKIEITLAAASYNDMHAALTRRFDETLFTFVKDG